MNKYVTDILRKWIPRKVQTIIRLYQIFNNTYGHSQMTNGIIRSGSGEPLPWITYPAIEFLDTLDLQDCDVFEFGSGSSTQYWARKAKSVMAVEKDPSWYEVVKKSLPENCQLFHRLKDLEYIELVNKQSKKFDIIVIDGAVRYPCAMAALKSLSDRGIIILDNSDWYPKTCEKLREEGFIQVDFAGFPPLNAFTASTSIFYKKSDLIQRKLKEMHPMGGRVIEAYDDKVFDSIDKQFLVT